MGGRLPVPPPGPRGGAVGWWCLCGGAPPTSLWGSGGKPPPPEGAEVPSFVGRGGMAMLGGRGEVVDRFLAGMVWYPRSLSF